MNKNYTNLKKTENIKQNVNNYNEELKDVRFENKLESVSTDRSQDSGSGGLSEVSTTERSNERRNGSNYSDVRSNERGTGSNESSISGSTERQDRDQNKEEFRIKSNAANDSNLQQVMRNSESVGGGSIGSRISENDGGASNNSLQNEYSNSNNGSRIVQSDGITTHLSNRNDGSLS